MQPNKQNRTLPILNIAILVVVGLLAGGILVTFINAKGASYFSDDPSACNNCHIMNEVYDDWSKSSHRNRATCNDCHLPNGSVSKWMAKAQSGVSHAYSFTFNDDLPANLTATDKSHDIVTNNCIRCHSNVAQNVLNPTMVEQHGDQILNCVSCHKSEGHKRDF